MFCRLTVVCKKRKPSSKTDGRGKLCVSVPKERPINETRVAATPKTVEQLLKLGFTVAVESGAGHLASFDEAFVQAGAVVDTAEVWQSSIILKVNAPEEHEIALLNPGTTLVSFIWPAQNP
jgi:NAD(P) transhydrogenase subunit alpha